MTGVKDCFSPSWHCLRWNDVTCALFIFSLYARALCKKVTQQKSILHMLCDPVADSLCKTHSSSRRGGQMCNAAPRSDMHDKWICYRAAANNFMIVYLFQSFRGSLRNNYISVSVFIKLILYTYFLLVNSGFAFIDFGHSQCSMQTELAGPPPPPPGSFDIRQYNCKCPCNGTASTARYLASQMREILV